MVRLISMAMTGYYRTMQRPRAHQPLSMLKYDPIGTTTSSLSPTARGRLAPSPSLGSTLVAQFAGIREERGSEGGIMRRDGRLTT